jgi:hypothetical protein
VRIGVFAGIAVGLTPEPFVTILDALDARRRAHLKYEDAVKGMAPRKMVG